MGQSAAVIFKEVVTFDTPFVVIQEFTFGVKQLGTLFTRDRRDGSGGCDVGILGTVVLVRSALRGRITRRICAMEGIAVLLGNPIVLLPLCASVLSHRLTSFNHLQKSTTWFNFSTETFFNRWSSMPAPIH